MSSETHPWVSLPADGLGCGCSLVTLGSRGLAPPQSSGLTSKGLCPVGMLAKRRACNNISRTMGISYSKPIPAHLVSLLGRLQAVPFPPEFCYSNVGSMPTCTHTNPISPTQGVNILPPAHIPSVQHDHHHSRVLGSVHPAVRLMQQGSGPRLEAQQAF